MKYKTSLWMNLPSLGLSIRILFTGYLLAMGFGLLMAGAQIMFTHGMADGKLGISLDDIVYSYYGDRNSSTLEGKLNGSMQNKAPAEVRLEIIKWARNGSPEDEWNASIKNLLQTNCVMCHSTIPGIGNFSKYDEVLKTTKINQGQSASTLTRVSHIHLFGISFIFFIVGFIFSLSVGIPKLIKEIAILTPFAFLILDVLSWWLTKIHPDFAILVLVGGFGYTIASTFMVTTSLYQMWILPRKGKEYKVNEWLD